MTEKTFGIKPFSGQNHDFEQTGQAGCHPAWSPGIALNAYNLDSLSIHPTDGQHLTATGG